MIGGLDPVIIVTIDYTPSRTSFLGGIPFVDDIISWAGGTPIPIYLNENLTGVVVNSESRNLNINVDREQTTTTGSGEKQTQKGVANTIIVNMEARRGSSLLAVFMAFADVIFSKAVESKARISYFNGSTVIINGWLTSVSVSQGIEDDLLDVSMTIEKPLPEVYNQGNFEELSGRGVGSLPVLGA